MAHRASTQFGHSIEPIVLEIVALVLQSRNRCVTHVTRTRENPTIANRLQRSEVVHQGAILSIRQLAEARNLRKE